MRIPVVLALCIACLGIGAGTCFYFDRIATGNINSELAVTRQSLDAARERSDGIERGLTEARSIAQGSAESVGIAVAEVGKITDRSQRIVVLIGAIKRVAQDLERISSIRIAGE